MDPENSVTRIVAILSDNSYRLAGEDAFAVDQERISQRKAGMGWSWSFLGIRS
jgi:hypothetical protein